MSNHDYRPRRTILRGRLALRALCLAPLILLAACGSAAPAVEPTATSASPTATPVPPTATPIPPTTTPLPTAAPELAPLPSDGLVSYNEPAEGPPWGFIMRRPDVGEPPYPWVLVTTRLQGFTMGGGAVGAYKYSGFTDELLARGYATVVLYTDFAKGREFCAWAWLEQNAAAYGLDLERAIVFSDGDGLVGPVLGVADDALWAEMLGECSSPAPSPAHIRGVATYSAFFMVPQGSLADEEWPYLLAALLDLSRPGSTMDKDTIRSLAESIEQMVPVLQELPPSEWRTSSRLDDTMRFVAHRMPLYYIDGPKPADQMPAFLLTHGEQMWLEDAGNRPIEESEMMAAALTEAGLSVQTFWLPDGDSDVLYSGNTDVMEKVVEAFDTWAQGLFAGD